MMQSLLRSVLLFKHPRHIIGLDLSIVLAADLRVHVLFRVLGQKKGNQLQQESISISTLLNDMATGGDSISIHERVL